MLLESCIVTSPHPREELRLKSKNVLYPPGLYKGLIWQKGGNNKLLYSGVQVRLTEVT